MPTVRQIKNMAQKFYDIPILWLRDETLGCGDIVRALSGDPDIEMRVEDVDEESETAFCIWFVGKEIESRVFALAELEVIRTVKRAKRWYTFKLNRQQLDEIVRGLPIHVQDILQEKRITHIIKKAQAIYNSREENDLLDIYYGDNSSQLSNIAKATRMSETEIRVVLEVLVHLGDYLKKNRWRYADYSR